MKSYQITDVKNFMSKLLSSDRFSSYLLNEAAITTFNSFLIDGRQVDGFYSDDEKRENPELSLEFSPWNIVRPICFQLIKGKRTPLNFRIILHANQEILTSILSKDTATVTVADVKSLVVTIKYSNATLVCTTATSYHTFTLDKTVDEIWDHYFANFLDQIDISYQIL